MIAGTISIELAANVARIQQDMERARRVVDDATTRMGNAAGMAKSALGAIAGVLSVAAFASWIKGAIDAADAAGKMSAKTGIAVKDLAGLQLAFDLGGAGAENIVSSMSKLNKAAGENSVALKMLGVNTKAAGAGSKELLYSVADAFAKMDDGAKKTAIAIEIFGKSGADMIPLLNDGSKGLREMDEMARKLGLTISQDAADAAGAFNDNLDMLMLGSTGVAQGIAGELLPTISSLSGSFLESMTSGDKLARTAQFIGSVLKILYTVALGTVEIFGTVGKVIGGIAALIQGQLTGAIDVLTKVAKGDLTGAWTAAKQTAVSMGSTVLDVATQVSDGWSSTGKQISDAWNGAGDKAFEEAAKIRAAAALTMEERKKAEAAAEAAAKKSKAAADAAIKARQNYLAGIAKEVDELGLSTTAIKLREGAALGLGAAELKVVAAMLAKRDAFAAQKKLDDESKEVMKKAIADSDSIIDAINDEATALNQKIKTYDMLPEAITRAQIAELEISKQSIVLTEAGVAVIQRKIDALNGLAAAQAGADGLGGNASVTQAKDLLEILTAVDAATKSAAAGMVESFGRVGSAIGGLTTALSGYAVQQQAIAAELVAAKTDTKNNPEKIAKLEVAAANASAQAKIKFYGDMAGAAKGFFKENSKGYKVMETTEKAFRAAETAMAIQTMLTKSGLLTAFTGLFVTSKAVQSTAEVGATGVSVAAAGTQASAWGITAVVKAIASMPFPLNLAAGAATLAAVIGIGANMLGSVSGGNAGPSLEDKQKAQGTGTVLGDDTAESLSIANSLDAMEKFADMGIGYQDAMLKTLRNIEVALGGAAKGLMQTGGLTNGTAFGTKEVSNNSTFGASRSTSIVDSGVKFSGTFGALRSGGGRGTQYEDVFQTSDGGMWHGNSTNAYTNSKGLGVDAMKPFALLFDNMGILLTEAGTKLGRDAEQLNSAINGISVDFGVSLRNMKGDELTDALNAGLSVAFDKVAKSVFPEIAQFQKMGEGLGETLVRVANDVKAVDAVFAAMGKTTKTTVSNADLSLGMILRGKRSDATAFGAEMSLAAKEMLVEAVGGIDQFVESSQSFMKNFLTEQEQLQSKRNVLNPVLAKVGLSTEGANAEKMFKDFTLGLDTSTAAGRETYAMLMSVQQAFKDVTEAAAGERADLTAQMDELTLSSAQMLAKQRAALDPSNRALFDQVQALRRMKDAQDVARDSMGDVISRMKSFGDAARALKDGLLTGSLSTLTPVQQEAELRRQYEVTKAAAFGNDEKAQANFNSIATAYLTASQKLNGGDSTYSAALAGVMRDAEAIAQWSDGQIDIAQASLNAQEAQLVAMTQMNATMTNVATSLMASDYSGVGTSVMAPLVEEIKVLRAEVAGLRKDQATQTGDIIQSNAGVTLQAANIGVDGTASAMVNMTWQQKTRDAEVLE